MQQVSAATARPFESGVFGACELNPKGLLYILLLEAAAWKEGLGYVTCPPCPPTPQKNKQLL